MAEPLDDSQINRIIQNVVREIGSDRSEPTSRRVDLGKATPVTTGNGMFHDPDSAVSAARTAYEQFAEMPLDIRKHIIEAMRAAGREYAEVLAQSAVEETGMGRFEDKTQKNLLVANKTPGPEFLDTTAWTGDNGLTIQEYAPYGLIASITPTTNPTSTIYIAQ